MDGKTTLWQKIFWEKSASLAAAAAMRKCGVCERERKTIACKWVGERVHVPVSKKEALLTSSCCLPLANMPLTDFFLDFLWCWQPKKCVCDSIEFHCLVQLALFNNLFRWRHSFLWNKFSRAEEKFVDKFAKSWSLFCHSERPDLVNFCLLGESFKSLAIKP